MLADCTEQSKREMYAHAREYRYTDVLAMDSNLSIFSEPSIFIMSHGDSAKSRLKYRTPASCGSEDYEFKQTHKPNLQSIATVWQYLRDDRIVRE